MYSTEFLDIPPLQSAGGSVSLPGSKSISNRVLLLSALSMGATDVKDLLDSDDTRVMLDALKQLGCAIQHRAQGHLTVTGIGGKLPIPQAKLFLGNAGTAMRPLTAALALLASVHGGRFELSGIARMHERPIGDLVEALRALGCPIDYLGNEGYPPLAVGNGTPVELKLDKPIKVRGDVSSQFLTALLLALPLVSSLGEKGQSIKIDVVGELISRPYIEITLKLLSRFGVNIERKDWSRFVIPAGSRYLSPGEIPVEGDASSASYFVALGAIAPVTAGENGVTIEGVGLSSIQGDIRFVEAAQAMGAVVTSEANRLHIRRGQWPLKAIDLDCNHIPDAAMTLAVMALYADGPTTLRNIASWRVKETDRIAAMAKECRKLGAKVDEGEDFIRITPPKKWKTASIHTYDDHRVAMCFSLAAFNPARLPIRIEDPKCVGKTFPDYFEALFDICEAHEQDIPVICIDGPSASGKGTLAAEVAKRLGYHLLDSGALYRLVGLAAHKRQWSTEVADLQHEAHAAQLAELAANLDVHFSADAIYLDGEDVTEAVRSEAAGMAASRVSSLQPIRQALLDLQHQFRQLPGLVADGRDMGTAIFPTAPLKVYLTADARQRAERRYKQLISKGISANIDSLYADLVARDERDSSRQHAPLKPAEDAELLDNSSMTIEDSVEQVMRWWQGKQQVFASK